MSNRPCDGCGRLGNLVQVYQTRGNDYYELWLCERCASVLGVESAEEPPTAEELLSGLLSEAGVCPSCGTSYKSISQTGAVGCAHCYQAFAHRIEIDLIELGMPVRHEGRYPERLASYRTLLLDRELFREQLRKAIEAEDYEKAASLRDQIDLLRGDRGEKR